jgi:hypothetical protein
MSACTSIVLEDVLKEVDGGVEIPRGRRNEFVRKLVWDIDPAKSWR